MKILFITNMLPVPDYAYFGIHVQEQIEVLSKNFSIEREIFFINGRQSTLNYVKSIFALRKKIKQSTFDIIHVHYGIAGLFLLFCKPNIPVILTLHSGEIYQKKKYLNHIIQKKLTFAIAKKVNKIIVLNDDMLRIMKRFAHKLVKIPCGINTHFFKPIESIQDRVSYTIGFPGNKARPEKNYALFIEIINILQKKYSIDIIEFHNMSRVQVLEAMHTIDILCMTSTIEGSPQIIKEAMACNIPIVSTAVGDVEDLLHEVQNAYIIHSFTAKDFVEKIEGILLLPKTERISNGRKKLEYMQLDEQSVAQKIYQLYQTLL